MKDEEEWSIAGDLPNVRNHIDRHTAQCLSVTLVPADAADEGIRDARMTYILIR